MYIYIYCVINTIKSTYETYAINLSNITFHILQWEIRQIDSERAIALLLVIYFWG